MYLYETHCHTKTSSACSRLSAEDIVRLYTENGYTGVFITDHFLTGNTAVDRSLPFAAQIHEFCRGYREVKQCAAGKLQVFFGLEYSFCGTDVLVYGWDEEALAAHEEFLHLPFAAFGEYCKNAGLLAVHAHPFREADYIDCVRLSSKIEGVETFNSARSELCNKLGAFYAETYDKPAVGGSDLHSTGQKLLSGMAFEQKLHSEQDFILRIRRREGKIFCRENRLAGSK